MISRTTSCAVPGDVEKDVINKLSEKLHLYPLRTSFTGASAGEAKMSNGSGRFSHIHYSLLVLAVTVLF